MNLEPETKYEFLSSENTCLMQSMNVVLNAHLFSQIPKSNVRGKTFAVNTTPYQALHPSVNSYHVLLF